MQQLAGRDVWFGYGKALRIGVALVLCLSLFGALLAPGSAYAQESGISIFVGGSFARNSTSNDSIQAFDGSQLCGVFQSGSKFIPNGYVGLTLPVSGLWSVSGALRYMDLSSNFETSVTPALGFSGSGYDSIFRDRTFEASLRMLGLSGELSYEVLPKLKISAGPFVGLLLNPSYVESESVVSPTASSWRYPGGLSTRTVENGTLGGTHLLQAGALFGANYELPLQPHICLRPGFEAILPFTQISDRSKKAWHVQSFGASLELTYHLPEAEAEPKFVDLPKPKPEPAPSHTEIPAAPKRPLLQVSVTALGLDRAGNKVAQPTLSIERVHVTEVYPMLHYVFFEDGSSEIPVRYHQEKAGIVREFDEKNLFTSNALDIHHHVLDIIGKRLAKDPGASITLVGTRSEHSPGDSAGGISVARARAESIREYLSTTWKIDPARVRIRERNLPEVASDDHNPFGEAENRRVEIIPSSQDITAPLWTERIERVATPPSITFEPAIRTNAGIRSATITVSQRGRILRVLDALDTSYSQFQWKLDESSMPDDQSDAPDSLNYRFAVVDSLGETASTDGVIYLQKKVHDSRRIASDSVGKQVNRFSLILFDYSSSQFDRKESERIVQDMAAAVAKNADVTLTGHTDKTGDESYNDRLAQDRVNRAAQMLKAQLRKHGVLLPEMKVESHGSRDDLFDNSIPEGRVLSRTVRALIEKEGK